MQRKALTTFDHLDNLYYHFQMPHNPNAFLPVVNLLISYFKVRSVSLKVALFIDKSCWKNTLFKQKNKNNL